MNGFQNLLEPLGWAVVHSLWQGVLILALVLGARKIAGPKRPHLAYLAGLSGLLLAFGLFLATFAWLIAQNSTGAQTGLSGWIDLGAAFNTGPDTATGASNSAAVTVERGLNWTLALPWLGLLWCIGFFALSLQGMYSWARTRCFATLGLSAPEGDWAQRFSALVERAGVSTAIRLRVSALVDSPVTLGTLKPLVLVPAGFLTGLPQAQVEAILLHEIAHIRRHDFLFGLLQMAIRITLYFNPAVLLMSRLVDEDREQACDDFAVRRSGNALDLVQGLASLRLSLAPAPAMAAKSGPLVARLERLTGRTASVRGVDRVSALAIAATLIGATVFATTSYAHPPEFPHDVETPPLPETVVRPGEPETPVPPTVVPPAVIPPIVVPPEPPFTPFGDVDPSQFEGDFEDRVEAAAESWAEAMEAWGESVGEAFEGEFEARMEAWGEEFEGRMESWAEGIEAEGERLEMLDDMSDAELRALGLTRRDVNIAAEHFGLQVAEGVLSSLMPEALRGDEGDDIRAQRDKLDMRAVERVERVLEREGMALDMDRAARDSAQVELQAKLQQRIENQSRALQIRAKRDAVRAQRDATRAQRDAERAARSAERDAERMQREAIGASRQQHNDHGAPGRPIDGKALAEAVFASLRDCGMIDKNAKGLKIKRDGRMILNGTKLDANNAEKINTILRTYGVDDDATLELVLSKKRIDLTIRGDGSTTRLSTDR